jgi:tetratricopeptide (TPR) repeat protein
MVQLLDARYHILKVLNTGEVGETYLAEDIHHSDSLEYVVKQLHLADRNPQNISITRLWFEGEAKTLAKLGQEHDQIQKILAFFEEDKEFYLVQDFIPGNPLSKEIFQGKPLREHQVISLLQEILETLVFVHNHGVIHRNIKPTNIIRRDSDDKLVLIDFGTVKEVITNVAGTPEYMPVEQFHGNTQFNSDIYALGIVAIIALTGLPSHKTSTFQNHKNLLTGEIVWRHKSPKVSRQLAKIIDKMVRFDYRYRYQSAIEVLNDLYLLTNQEYQKRLQRQNIIKLILTGIGSSILVALAWWLFLVLKPVDNTQQLYKQGLEAYQRGNYKTAVEKLTQAIEINPQNDRAYNTRGDAFYWLGEYDKAQADSSEAIRLNPHNANSYYDRGFVFYKLRKYKEAIADYNQAIELDEKNGNIYFGRGLARYKLKDKQGAIDDFTQAIGLKAEYSEAYLQRGIVLRRMGQKQAAIEDFATAIAITPTYAEAYVERGLTHYFMNERQAAIGEYSKAIEVNPKYLAAYLNRGDVYSELGKKDQANADYSEAFKINPRSADAFLRRGIHRANFAEWEEAIEDYNQAIQLDPNNAAVYNNRGNAHLELKDKKAAIADYSKAIEIDSDYALAYYNRGLISAEEANKQGAIADFEKAAKIFQEKGEEDSYKDAQSQITELQSASVPVSQP